MTIDQNQIINYLIRMVVPLRREFQRDLDVTQFQHDAAYARTILDEALSSQDPRLREFATYVEQHLPTWSQHSSAADHKPAAAPPAPAPAPAPRTSSSRQAAATEPSTAEPTPEEALLMARIEKYKKGLR